jgi:hypothetical protein
MTAAAREVSAYVKESNACTRTFHLDVVARARVHPRAEPVLDALHLALGRGLGRAQLLERVEGQAGATYREAVRLCERALDGLPAAEVAEVAHVGVREQW